MHEVTRNTSDEWEVDFVMAAKGDCHAESQ
jgi:hypothetical protein